MPDPRQYGEALLIAGAASGLIALLWRFALARGVTGARATSESPAVSALAGWMQFAVAAGAGFWWLGARPRLPPLTGLDRLLVVVFPALLVMVVAISVASSLAAKTTFAPAGVARFTFAVRLLFALAMVAALLHGSVYLRPADGEPIAWSVKWGMLGASTGIAVVWELVERGSRRGSGGLTLGMLAVSILATGVMILLGGYVRGGAAAFPLAGGLLGAAFVGAWTSTSSSLPTPARTALVSSGAMGLCGLAIVGRCFGGLTTFEAIMAVGSPAAAWIGEWAVARRANETRRRHGLRAAVQIVCVLLALAPAVRASQLRFEQKMRPLLEAERGGAAKIP